MSNEIIELIDKKALIKHLNTTMYRDVMEEIKNFPSVTPVIARQTNGVITLIPMKKSEEESGPTGKWVGNAFDEHYCNKCGYYALWEDGPDGYYEVQSRFCPNCGVKMILEEGDEE